MSYNVIISDDGGNEIFDDVKMGNSVIEFMRNFIWTGVPCPACTCVYVRRDGSCAGEYCVSAAQGLAPSVSEEPNEVSPEHSDPNEGRETPKTSTGITPKDR